MSEYPPETPGLDGTGLTEAVCPKHGGKPRIVSADALLAKGAPMNTFGLKCLVPLDGKKKAKGADSGSPIRSGEVSANGTVHESGAPADPTLCQEALVPVTAHNEAGEVVRKGGKAVEPTKGAEAPPTTGGQKLHRASHPKASKAAKNTARKASKKTDSRGGRGVSVAEEV